MYFELSEEHELFRKTVRKFVQKEVMPLVEEAEQKHQFPRSLLKRMGELGFLGVHYPEAYGGSESGFINSVIIAEELAYASLGIASSIIVHSGLGTEPIHLFGTEEQKQKYLVPAIRGEKMSAFGLTEPNAGSDVSAIQTTAVFDGKDWIINGSKIFITNGNNSDFVIVAAKTKPDLGIKGITLFIVEQGTPGFKVSRKLNKMGIHSSETAELIFEDCRVPDANRLGEEGQGVTGLLRTLDFGRIISGACGLGMARFALDKTIEHVKQRKQFNKAIAEFQNTQFQLANMAMEIELAHLMVYKAASLAEQGKPFTKEASMAKLFGTEMANRAADIAVQLHGGMGYMAEYPIERLYRDIRVFRIAEGSSEIQRLIIAKHLLK